MKLTKRVNEGVQYTEKEYRALSSEVSSSDIRTFVSSRKKFYKEVVCGERRQKDDTVSTLIGNVADCVLTCPEEMDNKFVISTVGAPAGQMGEFCTELFKRACKGINEEGVQTENFEVLFTETVEKVQAGGKFKGKDVDKILKLFTEPDKDGIIAELYYKECLDSIGKSVVDMSIMETGERKARELQESPYTSAIINQKTEGDIEVFHQLIVRFEYKGLKMRAMMDKVIVDNKYMTIQPVDIKTTYDNEGFENGYLKGYYIQAAVYDCALRAWREEHELTGYKVLPMVYPVADTQNENCPLLYKCTLQDITRAYTGFQLKGSKRRYPGIDELIESILWHSDTGIWDRSREAHEKAGIMEFEFEYI